MKTNKKKSGKTSTVLLVAVFVIGLSLMLYPSFSNYINSIHATRAIASYSEAVAAISEEENDALWQQALEYNANLLTRMDRYTLNEEEQEAYHSALNIVGDGVMGYIEIPEIDVNLPIYHGTSDVVLQVAVGHLEWTSLPTGGESTHCVLSGHRGLPSAKLFTNLDQLALGDIFSLCVLDEILTYEVDQIRIVEPDNISDLQIIDGEDLCTLMTCTPYGINTHRLLVRGHRVENAEEVVAIRITADAVQIEPLLVAPVLAIPLLLILIILVFINDGRKKKER